jgi:hypothetical protein
MNEETEDSESSEYDPKNEKEESDDNLDNYVQNEPEMEQYQLFDEKEAYNSKISIYLFK